MVILELVGRIIVIGPSGAGKSTVLTESYMLVQTALIHEDGTLALGSSL